MPDDASLRERDFFDRLVAERGEFNPFADRGWNTIRNRFEQFVATNKQLDLLDVGCGTGQSLQLYEAKSKRYVGIDLSSQAVSIAQQRFPEREWQVADACHLPFADETFDLVCFSSVLHHIPQYIAALREAFRVLRPGGQVFAYDPNLLHPAMAIFRCPRSPFYSPLGVSPNERPLLPRDLSSQFRQAGFTGLKQRCQADIPYRSVAPRLLNSLLSIYNFGDRLLEISGLGRWFGVFVVTAGAKPRVN